MSTEADVSESCEDAVREENAIALLSEKINSLYLFRDHYFEQHPIENAKHKNIDVENELKNTLNVFESKKESACQVNRAMYYYLKGRALNITPHFDIQAEEILSKAVKLDPKLVEAWNELGECYWKKDNIEEAKNCFAGALVHRRNKESLRNLSMVLRQQPAKSSEERIKNVEEGLLHAKEAVQLDTNDGVSWSVLGNAYLSSFFTISQNPKTLKLCMSAYTQAEKDVVARSKPDLHYNKAMALKYEEEYKLALDSFVQAQSLDPTWDVPRLKENELLKYLDNVQELVRQKGKLKGKRLTQMLQSLDPKQLGPYHGGNYTSPSGTSVKLDLIPLSDMKRGLNTEKVVLGKVVCSVHDEDAVPFTFCMIDKAETCVAVTVYNLAQGKGVIIGDAVAIPEPYFTQVRIKYKSKDYCFDSIRVESPLVMVVNGKKIGRNQQASVRLCTFKKSD
ncbi:tetratricopeptide repeat protein 5 [Anabrus simplex]|uniref:tetratricopeptide repeat protein 5 n=1 Tax=Anabrus simplex TaxID=316456 RepID=UPI0035A39E72